MGRGGGVAGIIGCSGIGAGIGIRCCVDINIALVYHLSEKDSDKEKKSGAPSDLGGVQSTLPEYLDYTLGGILELYFQKQ